MQDIQVLKKIFNAFDPFRPAHDPYYVDCQEVRGNSNIIDDLGKKIVFSERHTCQLYTGHRGGGKSTELLQLKAYLEKENYKVIYFAATEDIDIYDVRYADILFSCIHQLLIELKRDANPSRLLEWIKDRWEMFKNFATRDVSFDELDIEAKIGELIKIKTSLRTIPSAREVLRNEIDKETDLLTDIVNDFITEAVNKTANKKKDIVLIVDNLDRIIPVNNQKFNGYSYEEIFIGRGDLLRLQCHLIYTVPISMVYSPLANVLRERYNDVKILPMIMVNDQSDKPYKSGILKLKEVIQKRLQHADPCFNIETLCETSETLEKLCFYSGGHIRDLMQLMQTAIQHTPQLPVSMSSVNRAMSDLRLSYSRAINEEYWQILINTHRSKKMPSEPKYLDLLYYRFILEYVNDQKETWHDVHPVIRDSQRFKQEMKAFETHAQS